MNQVRKNNAGSPQYQGSTANSSEASEDADILNDVISICRDGEKLYGYVAEQVGDQRSRNMFSEMAKVRSQIVQELKTEVAFRGAEPNRSGTMIGTIRRWYVDARSHFVSYAEKEFVEQLEETEKKSLKVLRSAVREVEDRSLALRLSSLVATFQIAHDRMTSLKQSYN